MSFGDRVGPVPAWQLSDRDVVWRNQYSLSAMSATQPLDLARLNCGSGKVVVADDHLRIQFADSGEDKAVSQQLSLALPDAPLANGFGMRVRIHGWKDISYVAIGHTEAGAYHHVKAKHPLQGEWFDLNVGFGDIAWGWQNGWKHADDRALHDVRFYIKGVPGSAASCDLAEVNVWRERPHPDGIFGAERQIQPEVVRSLLDYHRAYFPEYERLARDFMTKGLCPLGGNIQLEWPDDEPLPLRLGESGSFQFSWHSQHPATILMLLAVESGDTGALFAARDLVADWLQRSFDSPDPNDKYAWYDHGVAERVFAMVTLYGQGQKHGFDSRFMTRLRRAIHSHSQLLASEVFYVAHQRVRYHNHAWFQDMALMAVGLAFPGWACADFWVETALARAADQFAKLIVRDGDFAVFAENSIGYHLGIERLVSSIGFFASLSGRQTEIPTIAEALSRFSALIRYPDGKRTPSQGDTFRVANAHKGVAAGQTPYSQPSVAILAEAGYALAKANHAGRPFMLAFFATSRTSTHKHADNLSFTLYLDGIEWLIDPSFYSHDYVQPLPSYLRGPVAHNALVVPQTAYAITPGLARLEGGRKGDGFRFAGRHNAVEGVEFERIIEGALDRLDLRFTEIMRSAGNTLSMRDARLMLHCGEGVTVDVSGSLIHLTHPASEYALDVTLPDACNVTLYYAQTADMIRGVTGIGLMESCAISSIEVEFPDEGNVQHWGLKVHSMTRY